MEGHRLRVGALAWSSSVLSSGSGDKSILKRDIRCQEDHIATLTGHTYRVMYLAVSPDGQTIVTGAGDETLKFWNVFPSPKSQMSCRRLVKRFLILDDDEDEDTVYSFKFLLPNSTSVPLTVTNPEQEMPMESFVNLVKEKYDKARKDCVLMSKRTRVDWNLGRKFHLDSNGGKMKGMVRFAAFKPNVCHTIRLDDGSRKTSTMYEDNSLQAVALFSRRWKWRSKTD